MSSRRRRRSGIPQVPHAGMNLVPLVDMALNLVLILLIMAPAMYMVRLPIHLPEAEATKVDVNEWMRVTVSADERLSVDGDLVDSWALLPEVLSHKVKDQKKELILMEVDKVIPYRTTSRLMEIVQAAGATRIAFATLQNPHATATH